MVSMTKKVENRHFHLLLYIKVDLLLYIKLRRLLYIELRLARDLYWLCRKLLLFNDLRAGRRAGRAITP